MPCRPILIIVSICYNTIIIVTNFDCCYVTLFIVSIIFQYLRLGYAVMNGTNYLLQRKRLSYVGYYQRLYIIQYFIFWHTMFFNAVSNDVGKFVIFISINIIGYFSLLAWFILIFKMKCTVFHSVNSLYKLTWIYPPFPKFC